MVFEIVVIWRNVELRSWSISFILPVFYEWIRPEIDEDLFKIDLRPFSLLKLMVYPVFQFLKKISPYFSLLGYQLTSVKLHSVDIVFLLEGLNDYLDNVFGPYL